MSNFDFNEIIHVKYEEIQHIMETNDQVSVRCDDGVLTTPSEDFLFNWICWQLFHALDNDFPSSVQYTVTRIEHITTRPHLDIGSWILKDYVKWSEEKGIIQNLDGIKKQIYDLTNLLYNFIDNELDNQTTDICFDHFNEIYQHPDVLKANTAIQNAVVVSHENIKHVYEVITKTTLNDPGLANNSLALAARCGVIKLTQLSMVLGPIGFCTDINSKIIPKAIRVGFFRGMGKLDDMLYESRNASIAALFNIVIMPLSEYTNRRTQLPCENVQTIVYKDCGAKSERIQVVSKAHLKTLLGFTLTDGREGRPIKYIEESDTSLIGQSIFIRSLNYCRHKVRNEVCSTCVGLMHYSFPNGCVVGHVSGTQLGAALSTSVLQRKHENLTSKAGGLTIDEIYQNYFRVNEIGNGLCFSDSFDFSKWSIVLTPESASHLKEVNSEYGDGLIPSQTTRIEMLQLQSKDGLESILMPIGLGQRAGFLTKEMLRFYKEKGWTFIDGNLYQLDLEDWDNQSEFLTIPQIEFTPPDLISAVSGFIFSGNKGKNSAFKTPSLSNCLNVDDAYASFYDLIKDHLKLHSVHLMFIILAMSAQNPRVYDYRLPYPRETSRTAKLDDIMFYRSAGGAMAYEEQNTFFLNPITYLVDRRPPHIYDSIIMG